MWVRGGGKGGVVTSQKKKKEKRKMQDGHFGKSVSHGVLQVVYTASVSPTGTQTYASIYKYIYSRRALNG